MSVVNYWRNDDWQTDRQTDRSSCDRNCKFVHHKSHMKCGGTEPGAQPRGKITACNHSGCGTDRPSLLDMLTRVVNVVRLGAAKRWQRQSNLNIITNHLHWQCTVSLRYAGSRTVAFTDGRSLYRVRGSGYEERRTACLHGGEWKVISSAYRMYMIVPSLLTSPGWGPVPCMRLLYFGDGNILQAGPVLGQYIPIQILKLL
jgi:hypothetical protein